MHKIIHPRCVITPVHIIHPRCVITPVHISQHQVNTTKGSFFLNLFRKQVFT